MNKYIDVALVKNKIEDMEAKYGCDDLDSEVCSLLDKYDVIDLLDEMPTADVQPVVHAHWKNIGSGHAECSNCGMTVSADYPASPCVHYCAKCGARMDGDEHDKEVCNRSRAVTATSNESQCPLGYSDCICDPAYIKKWYPEWYKELGNPETCGCMETDEIGNCIHYDDEDK